MEATSVQVAKLKRYAMNLVEHAIATLCIQAILGLATRNWWLGAVVACSYFVGREFAQAEYRWIEQFGAGLRANAPWWAAFDPKVWTSVDQYADILGPVLAGGSVYWFARRRDRA